MLLLSSVSETFFWGAGTPSKKGRMPSQTPILFGKGKEPNTKKGGRVIPPCPLTISPVHSSPHLPNNERSLVPGALSLLSLDDRRLCKIYSEYEICKNVICKGRVLPDGLGLNQCDRIGYPMCFHHQLKNFMHLGKRRALN